MKVAYYFGRINRGGAETLVADLLMCHENIPFQPVCIYRDEGTLSEMFRQSGAPMLKLRKRKSWLAYIFRLRRLIKKEQIDILHAQTSLNAIIAIICTAFTKVKVVTTFHGFGYVNAPKPLRWFIYHGSKRIIFVSEYLRQGYFSKGDFGTKNRSSVVYNGIDFSKFDKTHPKLQKNDGSEQHPLQLCMVGSFGEGRNHMFVCEFINQLKKRGIRFHFTFVGAARPNEQKLYDDCVKYCKEHTLEEYVTFAGLCNNVPEILGQMDAFVYATRHDSFGIAVIEAIASGLPTFTNDWCVMQEVTRNGQYAWLYKTGDINSLTELFIDFTKDPERYYQKARLSATAVKNEYSIEQHATNLYNEYSRIL